MISLEYYLKRKGINLKQWVEATSITDIGTFNKRLTSLGLTAGPADLQSVIAIIMIGGKPIETLPAPSSEVVSPEPKRRKKKEVE